MNLNMKHVLFLPEDLQITHSVSCVPPELYSQEADWTCALACAKSIASGAVALPGDLVLAETLGLEPGPIYSDKIKQLRILDVPGLEVIYGCDMKYATVRDLWWMLDDGWRVMTNWMYSYDHWTVLTAYMATEKDPDFHLMQHWDPYCGEMIHIRAGHFSVMWQSGGNESHAHDFIAVRPN